MTLPLVRLTTTAIRLTALTGPSVPGMPRGTSFIVVHGVTGAGAGRPSNQVEAVVR